MINNLKKEKNIIILLGPPGSGKGTLSVNIMKFYNYEHIAPGDIFRKYSKKKSEFGKKINEYLKSGKLVPNEIVSKIMLEEIKNKKNQKIIMDGYPRSIEQAKSLQNILKKLNLDIKFIFFLTVSKEIILERLKNRLVCPKCGTPYNKVYHKPKFEGKCNVCGSKLITRIDDTSDTIHDRINTYLKQTKPLINYYKQHNNFLEIDTSKDFDQYWEKLKELF